METKHYYAMHTPHGNAVDTNNTPVGTVIMFNRKRERDDWVEDNEYNTRTGQAHQTRTITEHEARVTMLRQLGRRLYYAHELNGIRGAYATFREYAQYCPTPIMYNDYDQIVGFMD